MVSNINQKINFLMMVEHILTFEPSVCSSTSDRVEAKVPLPKKIKFDIILIIFNKNEIRVIIFNSLNILWITFYNLCTISL